MASLSTGLCRLLGIESPIIQAAIGNATCPELAAAVSNAGGLGMLAVSWTDVETLRATIRATRKLTARPFGVNLVLDLPQDERLSVCLEESVPVISTFWGDPAPYRRAIEQSGAVHLHTVGSSADARRAVDVGVDAIVAQGWEAGGHVVGGVSTLALIPAVVDAVAPVPVIAAGGIADGRALAAVLALGAQGAWIGTRFLLAREANTHDVYRQHVIAAAETDTSWGMTFDGGWPDAPHRVIVNSTVTAWRQAGSPHRPNRPGEGDVVAHDPDGRPIERYWFDEPGRGVTGDVEALPLYAGQGVAMVNEEAPAAAIVEGLVDLADRTSNAVHRLFQ